MGVQADTATAIAGMFPDLGDANGFTGGDAQIGKAATQLSAALFNSIVEEVNAYIALASDGQVVPAFDTNSRRQMALAFFVGLTRQFGSNEYGDLLWSRRTFPATTSTTAEKDWRTWVRDGFAKNLADNTITNVCFLSIPNSSRALIEYTVTIVKVSDIDTFVVKKIIGSVKKSSGGVVTIPDYDIAYTHGALVADVDLVPVSGSVVARVSIAPDAGAHFNVHAAVTAVNVTTSTAT